MLAFRARHAARRPWHVFAAPVLLLTMGGGALVGLAELPGTSGSNDRARAEGLALPAPAALPVDEFLASEVQQRRAAVAAAKVRAAALPLARASRSRPSVATPAPAPPPPAFVRPGVGAQTSAYGPRWGRLHAGVDLAAGTGSPVRAVTAGRVQSAGVERGYGNCVRLLHADGTVSVYAHMSALSVTAGQAVQAGELLGQEGNTGNSTGPHLHFEIRSDGTPIDPAAWLRARGVAV